jgi:motility quorum-sensing regulator / GCU-specific mRNA interferase toxin
MRHRLTATKAAIDGGAAVGLKSRDIAAFLQTVERRHFVKSTTSYADHRQWQDVYNTPFEDVVVYIKFTDSVLTEFVLLSLKEK